MDSPEKNAFCTIVAKNYLGYARSLAYSIKQCHPESLIFCILADKIDGKFISESEPFTLIESSNLGISHFESLSFKYDVVELATAVKPYALEFILNNYGITQLIYLDPDIYVFKRLDYIFSLLQKYSILLTPHITQSFPEDDKGMIDQHILLAGIYNLGFIGIANSPDTKLFLKWWQNKLYNYCLMDSANGMCVDQRWIDFVPIFFKGVYIILEDGYNISYWNLHQQNIEFKDDTWVCNQDLLYFYHFSGVNINNLEEISKYQNRYNLTNRPELRPLFEFYRNLLLQNKQDECCLWDYTYSKFSDKSKIKIQDRKDYYRLGNNRHSIISNPFDKKQYYHWKKLSISILIRSWIGIFFSRFQTLGSFARKIKYLISK